MELGLFLSGLMISAFQLIYDLGSRMKIIDSNYKVINKVPTIIAIVFIVINVILISDLSDKIYYH